MRNFGNPGSGIHRYLEEPASKSFHDERLDWEEFKAAWSRIWTPTKYIFGGLLMFVIVAVAIAYVFAAAGG